MPDPNKIEGGRWDRVLRSKFNLKGAGSTSARISDDISPIFQFPYRQEDDFLIGDKFLLGEAESPATAAMFARCILTNASENKLLILDKIIFTHTGSGRPFFGMSSAVQPFVSAAPIFTRDGRWGPLETDVGDGSSRLQGAAVGAFPTPRMQLFASAVVDFLYEPNVVLQPGDHAFLSTVTVNTAITATFYWREHLMEPSESA